MYLIITKQPMRELQCNGDISRWIHVDQQNVNAPFVKTWGELMLKQRCEPCIECWHLPKPCTPSILVAARRPEHSKHVFEHIEPGHVSVSAGVKSGVLCAFYCSFLTVSPFCPYNFMQ